MTAPWLGPGRLEPLPPRAQCPGPEAVVAAHGRGQPVLQAVSAFGASAAASSASTSAVPGLASDVSRAARLTTGPYTSPNLVSTRPTAMPTCSAGKPLPVPVRAGRPERDLGRVGRVA